MATTAAAPGTNIARFTLPSGVKVEIVEALFASSGIKAVGCEKAVEVCRLGGKRGANRPLQAKGGIRYFGGSCSDAKNCVFRGLFGDGANSYVAEWVIFDGVSSRTVLSGDDDLFELFEKHMDPPVYE
jgi:hypothetical protein